MHRNRILVRASAALGATALALMGFVAVPQFNEASVTARFAAKTLCSCLFIDNRAPQSCRADLGDKPARVAFSVDPAAHRVSARAGWLSNGVAAYDPAFGCRLK